MLKKLARLLLVLFIAPFIWALGMTVIYSVIPPLSIPVISRTLSGHEIHWRWRSFAQISPHLSRMIVAAEDARFCQHNGVDWISVGKVANQARRQGKLTRGASTITMQTAKNLFLWPLPGMVRKPLEIPLAMWMDYVWGKKRTMEIYMNIAQFGPGIYGAEAASRIYFEKPSAALNPSESAALASILPAPEKRDPERPSKWVAKYAFTIKSRAGYGLVECIK